MHVKSPISPGRPNQTLTVDNPPGVRMASRKMLSPRIVETEVILRPQSSDKGFEPQEWRGKCVVGLPQRGLFPKVSKVWTFQSQA